MASAASGAASSDRFQPHVPSASAGDPGAHRRRRCAPEAVLPLL